MDDLENPNVTAQAEMVRDVGGRMQNEARSSRKSRRPTILMRLAFGATSALFGGVMLLIYGFPALSFSVPLYWELVAIVFVGGFFFGHLASTRKG